MKKILFAAMTAILLLAATGCNDLTIGPKHESPFLTFKGNADFTLGMNTTLGGSKSWNGTVEYSTDKKNWTVWDGTAINSAAFGGNNYIYLRGIGNTYFASSSGGTMTAYTIFELGGNATEVECTGNIMRLLDYSSPDTAKMDDFCFSNLFETCSKLTKAPDLPATVLAPNCYQYMFARCTSLKAAPSLPATTLEEFCYNSMFYECYALSAAPSLPATVLAKACCNCMFHSCTALTASPSLPATTLTENCYNYMFSACTNLTSVGKIADGKTVSPFFDSISSATSFDHMFEGCSSLKIDDSSKGGTQFVSIGGSNNPKDMFKNCKDYMGTGNAPSATKGNSYSFF